ncbi:hypothetical protein M2405_006120 [Rhodococcus erythropolis]|uniref:DUF2971 domain-containing protein n=1 Tax=Rhodococcus erythropolis TaxID=1833 RepID=UPI0021694822|nr:DUF2971 domain-containing protein [Rhodococcus erythropolis]MCS4257793.1 hypothetical protein [Rhodococcus erythropolis]MCW2425094.1 hypothetical protein [Rhodococcus erythropolis]
MSNEILYHYTSAAGLLGILDPVAIPTGWGNTIESNVGSFSLWATDTAYVNDSGELNYGRAHLAKQLRRTVAPDSEHDGLVSGLEFVLSGAFADLDPLEIKNDLYGPDRLSVYATCFCENGDLLSQWRGYGTGHGYSIGFRKDTLQQTVRVAGRWSDGDEIRALKPLELVKVQYGEVLPVLRETADLILERGKDDSDAWQMCLRALAQVKSDGFASEREWRLFDLDRHNYTRCEYRTGPHGVTPYTRIISFPRPQRNPRPIERVYVSPGPDIGLRKRAAEQLLRQRGFHDVDVVPSTISYRG